MQALVKDNPALLDELLRQFAEAAHGQADWFYRIKVGEYVFFVADNGEDGYTAMLPEEY